MDLTKQNFCPNIKNDSDSLRTRYICELNGKICPKVDYSSGKALPSAFFLKDGCDLLKVEEPKIEVQPEEIVPEIEIVEDVQPVQEPIEEVKEEKPQQKKTYNKKKNYKKNK